MSSSVPLSALIATAISSAMAGSVTTILLLRKLHNCRDAASSSLLQHGNSGYVQVSPTEAEKVVVEEDCVKQSAVAEFEYGTTQSGTQEGSEVDELTRTNCSSVSDSRGSPIQQHKNRLVELRQSERSQSWLSLQPEMEHHSSEEQQEQEHHQWLTTPQSQNSNIQPKRTSNYFSRRHSSASISYDGSDDLPSDEYFRALIGSYSDGNDYNHEEFQKRITEYMDQIKGDRLGSLKQVRRSIIQRNSLLLAGDAKKNDGSTTSVHPETALQHSATTIHRRNSLASGEINTLLSMTRRRRPSIGNLRRVSNISGDTLFDSITSFGENEVDNFGNGFSFDHSQRQNSLGNNKRAFTEEDSYISETERKFKGEEGFETSVHELAKNFTSSLRLLRRTRAISALAHRLMAAPDEAACIEEVTRLMVMMFGLQRVSFAMLTGSEHFTLKRVETKTKKKDSYRNSVVSSLSIASSIELEYLDSDFKRPLAGTAAGVCASTLKEHYTPQTRNSSFATHRVFYEQGLQSVLASPILVNGNQCMGIILLSKHDEDAFKKPDRVLIADIATLLGANIYAKRLRKESEEANKLSRAMLHSFVPPKVLKKIEGFWYTNNEPRPPKNLDIECENSPDNSMATDRSRRSSCLNEEEVIRSNSWYVAHSDWTEAQQQQLKVKRHKIPEKIQMMKKLNRDEAANEAEKVGVIITTDGIDLEAELNPTSRALYAENVRNVCIIFTDIVGFSKFSMDLSPTKVMNMLQNLFNRFDILCDVHGVMKLETIGDAYICATNLLEENADDEKVARDAAIRALAMAKDMVCSARNVRIPYSHNTSPDPYETLEIRVGIHVGDITCGVLGQRLPKFTTCGTTVNMAARMEQTSLPSMIRVTEAFHDMVGDAELNWFKKESVELKNMGTYCTYLFDPTGKMSS